MPDDVSQFRIVAEFVSADCRGNWQMRADALFVSWNIAIYRRQSGGRDQNDGKPDRRFCRSGFPSLPWFWFSVVLMR
jgi:hypothetical protein